MTVILGYQNLLATATLSASVSPTDHPVVDAISVMTTEYWAPGGDASATAVLGAASAADYVGIYSSGLSGAYIYIDHDPVQFGSVLESSDASADDRFATALAITADGQRLFVGEPRWEGATGTNRGRVSMFQRAGNGWSLLGTLTEPGGGADFNAFGVALAITPDGSTLVVGASGLAGGGTNRGGVYTFDVSGDTYVVRGSALLATGGADNDYFGSSLVISADGTILVVGATGRDNGPKADTGSARTYTTSGVSWLDSGAELFASDSSSYDAYGYGLALSSDASTLYVGAPYRANGVLTTAGGVYKYTRSGLAWTQSGAVLTPVDAATNDVFGIGLAIHPVDGSLHVGAIQSNSGVGSTGKVYTFDSFTSAGQRGSPITSGENLSQYGRSIAIASDGTMVVGANLHDAGSIADAGGVYTYNQTYVAPAIPAAKRVWMHSFSSITSAWWRIRITGTSTPYIGYMALGQSLTIPVGLRAPFIEPKRALLEKIENSVTQDGKFVGRSITKRGLQFDLDMLLLDPSWIDSNWQALRAHLTDTGLFFLLWDSENRPDDAALCWPRDLEGLGRPRHSHAIYSELALAFEGIA